MKRKEELVRRKDIDESNDERDFREEMISLRSDYDDSMNTVDVYLSLGNLYLSDSHLKEPTVTLTVLTGGLELSLVAFPFRSLVGLADFIKEYVSRNRR